MLDINDFSKKQLVFAFLNQGESLSFKNDNLIIKDKEKKIKSQITCYRILLVVIVGHTTITSGLIQRCNRFGFNIVFMTPSFRLYQILGDRREGNTLLRSNQYSYKSLNLAKHIVENKISNQRQALVGLRNKSNLQKQAVSFLNQYLENIPLCNSLTELLGYEGAAAKLYFENYFDNIEWKRRCPRVKNDMINAVLDLGYTVLFTFIEMLLSLYGFDLYQGVLHQNFYMRKSLVCDLVEPFRFIIDAQVKKGINLKQFKEIDFNIIERRYSLKWEKSPDYVKIFVNALIEQKKDIFLYIQEYYRCFMKSKPEKEFPVFVWR